MNGENIYNEINEIFDKHPEIDELGLISPHNGAFDPNKAIILAENNTKIGLSFLCITSLYSHCFKEFNELKERINDNIESSDTNISFERLDKLTRSILFINAENITALNIRKKLIQKRFNSHAKEIKLLNLIFTKHPKSGDAWAHRRWVLLDYKKNIDQEETINMEDEFRVCKRVAEIYPKNYYAWTHRWFILKSLTTQHLIDDFKVIENWIHRNISDYCGYHHRYLILTNLLKINHDEHIQLFRDEFKLISNLLVNYPGHESPWNYFRTLIRCYVLELKELDKELILNEQYQFVKQVIQDYESSYYEKQKAFAYRYLLTLKEDLNFNLADQTTNLFNDLEVSLSNQKNFFKYIQEKKN